MLTAFPNIGNLFIFLFFSFIFLYLSYKILSMMFDVILIQNIIPKDCSMLKATSDNLIQSIKDNYTPFNGKMVGGFSDLSKFYFHLAIIIYLSLIIINSVTYLSTYFCNHHVSYYIFIFILISMPLIFILNSLLFKYRDKLKRIYIYYFLILIYLIFSIIIFVMMLFSDYSIYTYLFPIGCVLSLIIFYWLRNFIFMNNFIRLLIHFIIISIFMILPFILSYIYNHYHLCIGEKN